MSTPAEVRPIKKGWKSKLRELAAKAIRWAAPKVADAVAQEVRRRTGQPPAGSGPWSKTGTGK